MKPGERHAHEMDAAVYWRQFRATMYFDRPGELIGTVLRLTEEDTRVDGANVKLPKVVVETDDGLVVNVIARQARLLAELVRTRPVVGDRIRVRYHGEADRAAPGMSKAKEFSVEVRRAEGPGGESHQEAGASTVASPPAVKSSPGEKPK